MTTFTEEQLNVIRQKSTEDMTEEEIAALPDHDKAIRGIIYDLSIYNGEWYATQKWQHPWIQKMMGWLAGEFGPFESSLDLGAGDTYYSTVLAEMGAEATAIEVSEDVFSFVAEGVNGIVHDLRRPLDLGRKFDLVVCLEVAEHIPEESADVLCDTIAKHCGGILIFTAALPGQGGHGHCNLQPFEYWQDRLEKRGLRLYPQSSDQIRQAWLNILGKELPWLTKNVVIFGGLE